MAGQLLSARRQQRLITIAAAICGVGPFAHRAGAQTTAEWINTSGGDWTDPTSWSTNPVYPNSPNYNALIDQAGTGPYSVNLENNITVGTLSLTTANATLNQTGGTFTANAVNVTGGTYQISGGTLTGTGGFGSAIGTQIVTGPGGLFQNQSGTLTNILIFGSGTAVNNGTIISDPPSSAEYYLVSNSITNNGVLQVNSGNTNFGGVPGKPNSPVTVVNSSTGVINANDAEVEITGQWTNEGVVAATNDGVVNLGGTVTTAGIGTINISSNSRLLVGGTIDNTGSTLTFSTISAPQIQLGGLILNGTVATGSNVIIPGSATFSGVIIAPGTNIACGDANFEGNWSNQGTIQVLGQGQLVLAGNFTTAGMGTITGSPRVFITGSLDNSKSSIVAGNVTVPWYLNYGSGGPGGTITGGTIASGSYVFGGEGMLSGVTIASGANVSASNGSIGASTLILTGPWTNNGAISVVPNSTLYVSGVSGPTGPSATVANNGTITQSSGIVYPGALSGTGALIVGNTAGGSTAAITVPSLTQSSVTINATGSLTITGGSGNGVNTLVINAGGQLDLTGTSLAVNYTPGSDPAATIRGYLTSGYNNDTWTGTGIVSSTAALNPGRFAVGYADGNVDQGTAAAANQVLVEYTLAGDANLDGTVNFADLLAVAQNFNHTLDTHGNAIDWADGDFNYDGKINFADLLLVAQNFNKNLSAGQLEQLPGSFDAAWNLALADVQASDSNNVPEPAGITLLGMCTAGLLRRRARCRQ